MSLPPALLLVPAALLACEDARDFVVGALPTSYPSEAIAAVDLVPTFDAADPAQERIGIALLPVVSGLTEITDLQFPPGRTDPMLVLRKGGEVVRVDVASGQGQVVHTVQTPTRSEQGLLGLAFHPRWPEDPRVFLNYIVEGGEGGATRISAWTVDRDFDFSAEQVLLEVAQPYANHNAGQLAFGPDGFLYIGLGDGGWRDDPHGHGQDAATLLGSMLRIDVDSTSPGRPYGIPADNPFLDGRAPTAATAGPVPPETFAIGLRNPWRYSFDPAGRLVVADVGQNLWEEVDLVPAGANLGWNGREGRHCFPPAGSCPTEGFVEPVWEYGHDVGGSVTGGYVYTGSAVPALAGRYVLGDFVSGRIWALELPAQPGQEARAFTLGKWPLTISTFGRDGAGEVYVADYPRGAVYRIVAAPSGG